jgi:hypothetical protein
MEEDPTPARLRGISALSKVLRRKEGNRPRKRWRDVTGQSQRNGDPVSDPARFNPMRHAGSETGAPLSYSEATPPSLTEYGGASFLVDIDVPNTVNGL